MKKQVLLKGSAFAISLSMALTGCSGSNDREAEAAEAAARIEAEREAFRQQQEAEWEAEQAEKELRRLAQQALEDETRSYKARATMYASLCFMYQRYGLTEKAEKLARSLPHAWESRELLLPYFLEKGAREEYLREYLPRILHAICSLIDGELMTNDERLYLIEYGNVEPVKPAVAAKKIAEFFM